MPPEQVMPEDLPACLQRHNVSLPDAQVVALTAYCQAVWGWNEQINLTRHTDFESFVARDLTDSLKLSEHIPEGSSVLDVGSGGGVPGIVLALIRDDLAVSLAESVGKKARALQDITRKLQLTVPVHAARAEDLLKRESYDVLTVRAVAPLRKLLFWFQQHSSSIGQLLLIKGPRWTAERDEAATEGLLSGVELEVIDEYRSAGHDNNSVVLSVRF